MIVALSGIGEQGIIGDIAVRPCLIGASPAIGHSAGAEDIVESYDRLILCEGATIEADFPGFCDYDVVGQFRPLIGSLSIDAGTVCAAVVVVGNRVIDEYRSTKFPGETSTGRGLIADDEILDDQSARNTVHVDAASAT